MDALAACEVGYTSIALMGLAPPSEALEHMSILFSRVPQVLLVSDSDYPRELISRVMEPLLRQGIRVSLVMTYPYKDLAEVPVEDRKEMLA